ncbi:uncharacterized protein M421DRAFT_412633 [Didymella exigua CBS 183.55]|uniref:Uncharacterized protein n=1 Tax=Didymella exigua CBS 183.55 TaxID=1150837 RepID=A0A6A5RPS4_9PLEO|nr:uncharacterized protein M421DRAFT_412633 [Didymella exigua CBS 183.55]KAF1930431.1 hypothetical protein M421DRAFT_412633 [Didymella exigua CBS 183.55]
MDQSLSNAPPSTSAPATQTQSRLPPNTISRKAPRKATVVSTPTISSPSKKIGPKPIKPKPKSKDKDLKEPRKIDTSTTSHNISQNSAKDAIALPRDVFRPGTPLPTGSLKALAQASKKRKVIGSDSGILSMKADRAEKLSPLSIASISQALARVTDTLPQFQRPQLPLPRFEYSLTPQLESIKMAFGKDNWTEYVIEIEKHELGEITDAEFEAKEWRIFQTPSIPGLQRAIKGLVVEQISDPEATE